LISDETPIAEPVRWQLLTNPVGRGDDTMRFRAHSVHGGEISAINVTPLIDVMLCLLVVFLISAPALAQRVTLDLPQKCFPCDPPRKNADPIPVSIDPAGAVTIGGQSVQMSALEIEFARHAATPETSGIVISIAPSASFDALAKVLGSARNAGIARIAFADR